MSVGGYRLTHGTLKFRFFHQRAQLEVDCEEVTMRCFFRRNFIRCWSLYLGILGSLGLQLVGMGSHVVYPAV